MAIMDRIKALPPGHLDEGLLEEAVHHAASEAACAVNNGGEKAQVIFLLEHGYTKDDVLFLLDSPTRAD
jgi:hypothetical protein